jgi:hypothetical protein
MDVGIRIVGDYDLAHHRIVSVFFDILCELCHIGEREERVDTIPLIVETVDACPDYSGGYHQKWGFCS